MIENQRKAGATGALLTQAAGGSQLNKVFIPDTSQNALPIIFS